MCFWKKLAHEYVARLYDEVYEPGLTLSYVGMASVHELTNVEAELLFLVSLVKEFEVEKVRPFLCKLEWF